MDKILIIEDEIKVAEVLKAYLEREGYEVYAVNAGREGVETFKKEDFKLVIIDLMLPDMEGEEVCKVIRSISDVYIFILTAKGTLAEKIEGLDMGADEYLVKPHSPREVVARVNAVFRRINGQEEEKLIFQKGELEINSISRTVFVNGEEVNLTPNEFDILYTLANEEGRAFSREQLIEKIFGLDYQGFDRAIDVHIKNIRKKIEEDSKNPKYIKTVSKIGYKFEVGDNKNA